MNMKDFAKTFESFDNILRCFNEVDPQFKLPVICTLIDVYSEEVDETATDIAKTISMLVSDVNGMLGEYKS